MAEMTMRERMIAVIQGKEYDRVPFVQYHNVAAPYTEIWARIGRENLGLLRWCYVHQWDSGACRIEEAPIARRGLKGLRRVLHTPDGELWEERLFEPTYGTGHIESHFVKEPKDYKVLLAYLRSVTVRKNTQLVEEAIREYGDAGLPHVSMGRTPYQQLWVEWVSLEDLCLHMADEPELVEEVMTALAAIQRRHFEIACQVVRELPVYHINIGDNITAPIIGPAHFRRYCVPQYDLLAEMLDLTGKDIPVFVHMDGDLKPLWDDIAACRVRGLDSFSPPPDNDTPVADAVRLWPRMRLWVNFPSSVHLRPPREVYEQAMRILTEGGHTGRLQIQVSENVPPGVWQNSFPQIVRAIHDFGRP